MSKSTKFDEGKPRMSLVDPQFTEGVARVLTYGAAKYPGHLDWRRGGGLAFSRLIDALHRHLAAFELGEDFDRETGLSHLYHAAANTMMLQYYINKGRTDLDDRHYSKTKQDRGVPEVQGLREGISDEWVFPESGGQERLDLQDVQQPQPQREAPEADPVARGYYVGLDRGTRGDTLRDPLVDLQDRIATWADRVYPHRTTEVAFAKMMGEIGEVLLNPENPLEWADVVILLVDAAKLRGVDILQAAHEKMAINEKRQWEINPETGLMSHVGDK